MDKLTILQIVTGLIWLIIGVLIVIWLFIPIDLLLVIIWWELALGCILTGIWLLAEPLLRKKTE